MTELVSVCGLIVIPGREPQGWECGLYHEELDSVDLGVALNFTRAHLADEGLGNGHPDVTFLAAAFHPGGVDRCPGIEYADTPVDPREEQEHHPGPPRVFTVCGLYPDNWQTYSGYHQAVSPRMAYLEAWEQEQNTTGRYLYVANVHEGRVGCLVGPSGERPAWGDPGCRSETEMTDLISGWDLPGV